MNKEQFASYQDEQGNGACDAFPRPEYRIRGATVYDQKWADKTTEAGVAGCEWERPDERPASLDAKPASAKPMYVKAPVAAPGSPSEQVKRRWLDRFRKQAS